MAAALSVLSLWTIISLQWNNVLTQDSQCQEGWTLYNNACYGFGENMLPWAEAQEFCEVYNSRLAEIEDAAENEFLKNMAKAKDVTVWVGGTDIFNEGTWEWSSTGKEITEFTDWAAGEPNQNDGPGGEDCLQIYKLKNYQWNDNNCHNQEFFICETGARKPPPR